MKGVYFLLAALSVIIIVSGCIGTGQTAAKAPQDEQQDEAMFNSGKIVMIKNTYSDIVLLVAAGAQPVNTSELKVFVGAKEQRCIWDRAVAQPGEQFACQLEEICATYTVTVVAPGNFDQAQC